MDKLVISQAPEHAVDTIKGLDHFRKNFPQFCDFTLIVNGQKFPCHRSLLCLHSEYFRGMIGGKFLENCANVTHLKGICCESLAVVLDYIYTGTIEIDQTSVERILETASRMQIQKVIDICVSYLRHQIDETNALAMHRYGMAQGIPELAVAAKNFTYDRMEEIFGIDDVVKNMTSHQVEEILGDNLAHLHGEEQIIMSVLKWITFDQEERMKDIEKLLENIEWSKMSTKFILRTLFHHPLLQSNKSAKQKIVAKIRDVLNEIPIPEHSFSLVYHNDQEEPLQGALSLSWLRKTRHPDHHLGGGMAECKQEALLLVGGLTLGEAERGDITQPNLMCYYPRTRTWEAKANWPERKLRGFSVTKCNNDVIVTGGCECSEMKKTSIKRAWMYIVQSNEWKQIPDMTHERSFHGSCEVNSAVFAIGGAFADKIDIEVYHPQNNSWLTTKKNAPKFVWNFTVAPCNGKILLIGSGENSRSLVLQCFNPAVAQWSLFRSPNIPRLLSAPLCTTSRDMLFLSGDNSQKMFVFDPNENEWSRARDMQNLHANGGMTTVGGAIYLTGGHWEDDGYWDEMESFNTDTGVWTEMGPLPHLWLYHACISVIMSK